MVVVVVGVLVLFLNGVFGVGFGFSQVFVQESVCKEVGVLLIEVSWFVKVGKYKEVLVKLCDVEVVGGCMVGENNVIEGVCFLVVMGVNEFDMMVCFFEVLKGVGKLLQVQQLQYMEVIVGIYLCGKDNGKVLIWVQCYFKEGGNSVIMKQVL